MLKFPFLVVSCFPRSSSLPPPSSSKHTTTITTITYKLRAAALRRLLDGNGGLETHLRLESPVCFSFFSFILLLIFITATLLLQEVPVAATEVDKASQQTRTREVDGTRRINESTGTRQMVNPPRVFFLFFFILYLIFVLATTITLTTTTMTGNDQTQTLQTRPLNVSMTATAAAVAARDTVSSC